MNLYIPDRPEPTEGRECEPDSSVCTECCDKWKRDECMQAAHYKNECWFSCKYCEEGDVE